MKSIDDSLTTMRCSTIFIYSTFILVFTHFMTHDPTYDPFVSPLLVYILRAAFSSSLSRKLLAGSHRASREHGCFQSPWTSGPLHTKHWDGFGLDICVISLGGLVSFGAMGRGFFGVIISFLTQHNILIYVAQFSIYL